ncbi:MAG TPA: BtrH N-terminal domain-containing protein [Solirubrobacterales bacterium]|nr:BtrH N-terminal domain-containing protein [Solirubrobacterales bacterium]
MPSVPGYVHTPGNHCGSTALRNLLGFHGIELSEEMAFGLGAGAGFYYLTLEDASPSRWFNGRTARLEESFRDLTGAALELRTFAPGKGDAEAWEAARAEVDAGNPALLLTDIYYLDHYGNSAHFPGHAVVLAGYDDEVAQLSDTGFEQLQETRLENLAKARHSGHPAYPLEGHMFTVADRVDRGQLEAAVPAAIARAAREMREPPFGEYGGLPAVERLAAEAGSWPEAAADWQWCARFAYQVIERRGTGGGAFRLMYSRFLEEAGREQAPLASAAAARWTELAAAFKAASENEEPIAALWAEVGAAAKLVAAAENRLWSALAPAA